MTIMNNELFQSHFRGFDTDHNYSLNHSKKYKHSGERIPKNPDGSVVDNNREEPIIKSHFDLKSGRRKRQLNEVNNDNNEPEKKARLDLESDPRKRQLEKEIERRKRRNELNNYFNTYSTQLTKKAKQGNKTAQLYKKVITKQHQTPTICTCCMRKLYDGITKLTNYKRTLITEKAMDKHSYYFKESEFLCDYCWNYLRRSNISKIAATKNFYFIEIPDYLKRLSPLGARLVSPWLPFMQIVPLQQFTVNPQLSIRGSIVNIQVEVGEMMKCLPRHPRDTQVIQILLKRKKGYNENEEFFTQFTQKEFSFVVDEKDKEYLLKSQNEIFTKFNDDDDDFKDNDCEGNFDMDDVLVIDQNREAAELTRIIAPGENKRPVQMYDIPSDKIFCFPQIFGGEPFDEANMLSANERHKLWLTHNDSRCRIDPTFVLLLGQMTVQKRTRDSMNFVTRRGYKAYKFLKPIVGSPAYLEDKKKFLITKISQIGPATLFVTFSIILESAPYVLQQLYEDQYDKKISLQDVLEIDYNGKLLLIRNNPVTCARYINRYFNNILNCLQKISGPFKVNYVEDYVQKDEVQQKGTLHRHMLFWLNDAPTYNPEDGNSISDCVQFIDKFITCRLDQDNPYVIYYQHHKHTVTCYKGSKNLKKFRFHYPMWPMPETKILTKLPSDQRTPRVKLNFQKIIDYLDELSKSPRKISFAQLLIELKLSELEYIEAARYPLQTTRVFLKRESNEILINAYNPDILNLLRSNMDIQFICDAYACVTYLTDYVVKVEKEMAKLFRNLTEQFAQGDYTNSEKVKIIGNAFINKRVLAGQAAASIVLHIPGFKSSRYGVIVPTFHSDERTRVVKNNKELSEMAPDLTDIYQEDIIEKYSKRKKQYESLCLADVATGFNNLNKIIVKSKSVKKEHHSENELSACDDNKDSDYEENIAKQCSKRKILRTQHYNKYQDEENYYREQNRALIYKMDPNYIEDLVKEAEANKTDDEDENGKFIVNDNESNFNESTDIFTEINKDGNPESTEKDYKISVPTVMEESNILELLLKANEQQLQITMHCLHAQKLDVSIRLVICGQAGTGKSFLIKLLYQTITNYCTKQIPCLDISSPRVVLAAPSGKAAFIIGGITDHSCYVLPSDNKRGNLPALSSSTVTSLRFEMRYVKVIIIDEVSMIGRNRLNQIDTRLQQITGNNSPFGGLSVIFVGDLRQLPPVMDKPIYYTAHHYLRDKKLQWDKQYAGKPFKPNIADPNYATR
ncbi:uncharacterized protein LOC130674157 [Microplitis mediator]|uniref:uncharacterized protein LOC130674157 n=1 Tax=Microplitis mediator TaxID=375433 RepID=UPI0025574DA9|nr:uncharacterized protein LOC130674157 [Microplitis mediator]